MKALGLNKQSDREARLCDAGWLLFQLSWPEALGTALGPKRAERGRTEGETQRKTEETMTVSL